MSKKDSNLQLYQKYLDLIYYTNDLVKKYPKSEKFAIVTEIKSALYIGVKDLVYAQKEFKSFNRLHYLNDLDVQLRLLKLYIRLSYRYKYISIKNYETWSKKITNICNMLVAWIKTCLVQ